MSRIIGCWHFIIPLERLINKALSQWTLQIFKMYFLSFPQDPCPRDGQQGVLGSLSWTSGDGGRDGRWGSLLGCNILSWVDLRCKLTQIDARCFVFCKKRCIEQSEKNKSPLSCYRKGTAGLWWRWRQWWRARVQFSEWAGLQRHWKWGRGRAVPRGAEVDQWPQRPDRLPKLPQPAVARHDPVSWEGGATQPRAESSAAQVHQVGENINLGRIFP